MRQEFTAKVKREALARSNGYCEGCTKKLFVGDYHYDHDNPDGLTGEPTLENCRVLCKACHGAKTVKDVAMIARAKRRELKHAGIKKSGWTIPGRKFDGTPIPSRKRG